MVFFPMGDPSLRNSMPASTRMNLRDLVASLFVTMWNAWRLLGVSIYDPCQDSGSRSFDLPSPFLASTLTGHENPSSNWFQFLRGGRQFRPPDSINLAHTCIAITQRSTSFILASHSIEMKGYSTARTRSAAGIGVLHFCFSVMRDEVRANSSHLMLYPITSSAG